MNTLATIASELASLAVERGWANTVRLAEAVRNTDDGATVAVVRLLDGDAHGLADWIRQTAPDVRTILLDGNADQSVTEGWLADRVLTAFPCGGLPTTEVIHALTAGPFRRPAGTHAVVLTGADQISSPEDLTLVEATAWKWLLPPTLMAPPSGDLREAGAFLYADGAIADSVIRARIEHDKTALTRWLATPRSAALADRFHHARLAQALEQAATDNQAASHAPQPDRRKRFEAAEDLAGVRARVLARLHSDIDAQVEALRVAVDGLEADLLAGLSSYFTRHPLPASPSPSAVRQAMEAYCSATLADWESQPRRLAAQWQSAIGELQELIRSADWSSINAVPDPHGDYPGRLLERLQGDPWTSDRVTVGVNDGTPLPASAGIASPAGVAKTVGLAFLGCLAGWATGLGPLGMAVGGGLTTTVAVGHQVQSARAAAHTAVLEYARQVIAASIPATRDRLMQHLEHATDRLRYDLTKEFDRADSRLHRDQTPTAAPASVTERLAELQREFDALPLESR